MVLLIYMEDGNKRVAEKVARELMQKGGTDVQVKNGNGKIVLAALSFAADNMDTSCIKAIVGVERIVKKIKPKYYSKNWSCFMDASRFFGWGY